MTVNVNTVKNQNKTITANGTYTPDAGYTGFGTVTVNINTVNNTNLTVTPKTTSQSFTSASPYTGYGTVTVNAVTSAIDSNITAANIKSGVKILGVTGTLQAGKVQASKTLTVGSTTATTTTITPDSGYDGIARVTVDLTWIENQLKALNAGDSSSGTSSQVTLQDITLTQAGTYVCDGAYDGFGTVTVDLDWVDAKINAIRAEQVSTSVDAFLDDTAENIVTDSTIIRSYACYYQTALNQAVLNNCTTINEYAFANSGLQKLIINTQTVCTLTSSTAFEGTVIASGTGSIYVPDNLVSTYKTATNWNLYADQIVGVSTL